MYMRCLIERKGLTPRGEMSKQEHGLLHSWIRRTYGRAKKCSNHNCRGSPTFHWALRTNKKYERNIKNYIELCASCHNLYDYKEVYGFDKPEAVALRKIIDTAE